MISKFYFIFALFYLAKVEARDMITSLLIISNGSTCGMKGVLKVGLPVSIK